MASDIQARHQDLLVEMEHIIEEIDSRDRSDAELVALDVVLDVAVRGLRLALRPVDQDQRTLQPAS